MVTAIHATVISHVLGKAMQAQSFLHIHLRKIIAVGWALVVLVLTEIDSHRNSFFCHVLNFVFVLLFVLPTTSGSSSRLDFILFLRDLA